MWLEAESSLGITGRDIASDCAAELVIAFIVQLCYIVHIMQLITHRFEDRSIEMEKVVNSSALRSKLSPILDQVQFNHDPYIIERNGKPAAAIVPLSVYTSWKQSRDRFFENVRKIQQANQDADPDEVMAIVLEAQQAVRNESVSIG